MPEAGHIPKELMVQRLTQSEQMREFFIQMWLQNPALAQRAGAKVQALIASLDRPATAET